MRVQMLKAILLCSLLFAGCTVGPAYNPPSMEIPDNWQTQSSEEMIDQPLDNFVWWEALNDPVLNRLIQDAAHQNLDLFIAGTRILEARAEVKGKGSDLYPHVDASVTCGHLYYSKDALLNGIIAPAIGKHHHHHGNRNVNFFEIGFDAGWEIDLFGLTKHEMNALQARLEAAEENLNDIWVSLSAEIGRNYIELRSLQQRQSLLLHNVEAQKESIHLTHQLFKIGIGSSIDLLQAEEQLSLLEAQKPQLVLSIEKAIHRLSILLGYAPGDLYRELCEPMPLPQLPCGKPIGIPSELLRRRPDIRRAERDLAAATEYVGVAVASLFPRISLMGFIGDISTQLKHLTSGAGNTWFGAPQLLMPIFNSRLLQQDVDLNKIRTRQALFEYQKTVLTALEEVENGIAAYRAESDRQQHLDKALQIDQHAYHLALDLHERGIKDYLEVLVTHRALLAVEDARLQNQTDLLLHFISLYKALGGDWSFVE